MIDPLTFTLRFGPLSAGLERQELEALLQAAQRSEVAAGEVLITQGTATDRLYLVWEGEFQVWIRDGQTERQVGMVSAGDYLGEISLLDPGPTSATVLSDKGATVLAIEHDAMERFTRQHPAAGQALLRELSRVLAQRVRLEVHRLSVPGASPEPVSPTQPLEPQAALEALPGLAELSPQQRAQLIAAGEMRSYQPGSRLGEAGRRASDIFLLLEGSVGRVAEGAEGGAVIDLQPGALAGAEALLGQALIANLVAESPVRALVIPLEALARLRLEGATASLALERAAASQLARELRALAGVTLPASTRHDTTDVAVIGAGPLGLAYAWFVKEGRPHSNVTVLERRPQPGYKIGESTLGTTTRAMIRLGLDVPVLRRLFGIKSGIRFWWTGEGDHQLHRHVDAVDIDETFQVERRVLETALQERARRQGIDIRAGTPVRIGQSRVGADEVVLQCDPDGAPPYQLNAQVVCDASGLASVLPRQLGLYRRDPARLGTFNCNAYYAYFRQREEVPLEFWEEPATRHICFPQGWCWFISVVSWEGTPQENLERMISHLLDHPPGPDESYPTRRELEERFGCTSETILSVGFVIREDQDTAAGESLDRRFNHYVDRYPVIRDILAHYDLIEAPYGRRQPYAGFLQFAHDVAAPAGDGWCTVGDAAMLSNPLLSPGLNFGSGTAYEAALDTVRALKAGDRSAAAFRAYRHYIERTYRILMALNDMFYRSFVHPEIFERAMALFFFHAVADVLARVEFSESDPYVWDLLNAEFEGRVEAVRGLLRAGEERGAHPTSLVSEVRALIDPYIAAIVARPEVQALDVPTVLREFGPDGERAPRDARPGQFHVTRCPSCRLWFDATLQRCPICGVAHAPKPAAAVTSQPG